MKKKMPFLSTVVGRHGHTRSSSRPSSVPLVPLAVRLTNAARANRAARVFVSSLPMVVSILFVPLLAHAGIGSGGSTSLRGSLNSANNDLLDFLQNDVATLCMIVGAIFAAVTHVFNNGQGTKFFLSIFGCGVVAMGFTTILSLARGLATSVGH